MPIMIFLCLLPFCVLVSNGAAILDDVVFQNKCIEDLGCFYTGPPYYDPIYRPVSLAPSDNIRPKFLLYTPSNPEEQEELSFNLECSSFNPWLPIRVLVHGFNVHLTEDDKKHQIKTALLSNSDCNMIIVDWTEYSAPPYPQAFADARVVAAQLAKLLQIMMDMFGIRPENIYIIGHSLGAHLAGWTGKRIPNIGRITGLDPAGPYFRKAPPEVRLDPTDALFVDVIHTNAAENIVFGAGIDIPLGHMDFYPNGGRSQPGCAFSSDIHGPVGTVVNTTGKVFNNSCDHSRAYDYFLESIDDSECHFLATRCKSYEDFEMGYCSPQNSVVSEMGFHTKKIPGLPMPSKFFLRTNSEPPFCVENSVYQRNCDDS